MTEQWGDFCQFIPHLDWGRPRTERRTLELTENIISVLHGKVSEWNSSADTATGLLEGMGVETQPVDFRFGQVMTQLQRWMIFGAATQRPLIFLGTSHNGHDVRTFHRKPKTIQHPLGALVTPSELADFLINGPVRTQHFWIDPAAIGDVLGGSWNVHLRTRMPLTPSTVGYAERMTLSKNYLDIGEEALSDPPGAMRKYAIPYSVGFVQEIAVAYQSRRRWLLSRNSQLAAQILHDVWQQEAYLPANASTRTPRILPNRSCYLDGGGGGKRCQV